MKLRIRDNSVRLRLERGEVAALRDQQLVAATTGFADGSIFGYRVECSRAIQDPEAMCKDNSLVVRIPEAVVNRWAGSEQVSIQGEQALPGGKLLAILIEKDFACLAPREGEDESDMYPHPQADDPTVQC